MTTCNLSLRYTLVPNSEPVTAPRFTIEPGPDEVRFRADRLHNVDGLDVRWSTREDMKDDPVKAYLAKIGARGRAVNSKAQQKTARANGANGGRPKGAKDRKPRTRRPS